MKGEREKEKECVVSYDINKGRALDDNKGRVFDINKGRVLDANKG